MHGHHGPTPVQSGSQPPGESQCCFTPVSIRVVILPRPHSRNMFDLYAPEISAQVCLEA